MKRTKEKDSRINMFASDIIRRHIDRGGLGYKEEIVESLLRILPTEVKDHPAALRKAVEAVPYSQFNRRLRDNTLDKITIGEFSNDAVEHLRRMYTDQNRMLFYFALAQWTTEGRSRLSSNQIVLWESDESPKTQRLSKIRARGAHACIDEGSISVDERISSGPDMFFKLDRGIFQLLRAGLDLLLVDEKPRTEHLIRSLGPDAIDLSVMFTRVAYQST